MGCPCTTSRNILDERLNEIVDDCYITLLPAEDYLKIVKNAVNSDKNINDKFIFQTEILDFTIKSTNLYIQLSYLKSVLINFNESGVKCYIIFALLFLCKFESCFKIMRFTLKS